MQSPSTSKSLYRFLIVSDMGTVQSETRVVPQHEGTEQLNRVLDQEDAYFYGTS